MTDGEKMVWAAAFALKLSQLSPVDSNACELHAHSASQAGYRAVIALRFAAPDSEFRTAMLGEDLPRACPTFKHTRGDGPFNPCKAEHQPNDYEGKALRRAALRYAREALAQALDGTNIDTVLRTLDALADQAIK